MSLRRVLTTLLILLMTASLSLVIISPLKQDTNLKGDQLSQMQLLKLSSDIEDCTREDFPPGCVDKLLTFIPNDPVLRYRFIADYFPAIGDCHSTAHHYGTLAQVAATEMPKDLNLCDYGFIHGYLTKELTVSGLPSTLAKVKVWCGAFSNEPCWHGIGHGLASTANTNTPEQLFRSCSSLDISIQISCARGLAMELGHYISFGYNDCAKLSGPFEFVCDSEVAIISGTNNGTQSISDCISTKRLGCSFGIGRALTNINNGDASLAVQGCKQFNGDSYLLCITSSLASDKVYLSGASMGFDGRCEELYEELSCENLPKYLDVSTTGRYDKASN